jgi:hypothetical protein
MMKAMPALLSMTLLPGFAAAQTVLCDVGPDCNAAGACQQTYQSLAITLNGDLAQLTWDEKFTLKGTVIKDPDVLGITEQEGAADAFFFVMGNPEGGPAAYTGVHPQGGAVARLSATMECAVS